MKYRLVNDNFKSNYGENLLHSRGIEDVEAFMNPSWNDIQDPFDLENMEAGVKLLWEILEARGRIGLIVDSDCDGYTSGAVMYQYIKAIAPEIEIDYFLHEHKQHGLEDQINKLENSNTHYDLILCPDSASNDFEYCERLAAIGTKVLVLDHHEVDREISSNAIVINNQISPHYRNKFLSGVGIAWQFCRAYDKTYGFTAAAQFIDLVALGVIGDMMDMREQENRAIAYYAFQSINNYFFQSLLHKQAYSITGAADASDDEITDKLSPITVAFYIVPLINSLIRVGSMDEKERMFLAFIDGHRKVESHKRGAKGALEEVAVECCRECTNARTHQNKYCDDAVARIEQKIHKHGLLDNKILFIKLKEEDDFPQEVNGLVAMKTVSRFSKPTIVARENSEGFLRGSIRGLNNSEFDDFKGYLTSTGLCEYVQGHANAAGLSIAAANLQKLMDMANEDLAKYNFSENSYDVNFVRAAADGDLNELAFDLDRYKPTWG